ncbi:uncharacterized protein PGTG_03771, partial [Puccinia graminis f. sp. tritici CRL 75-36-700-3]
MVHRRQTRAVDGLPPTGASRNSRSSSGSETPQEPRESSQRSPLAKRKSSRPGRGSPTQARESLPERRESSRRGPPSSPPGRESSTPERESLPQRRESSPLGRDSLAPRNAVVAAAPTTGLTLAPGVVAQKTGVVAQETAVVTQKTPVVRLTAGVVASRTTVVNPPNLAEHDPSLLAPVGAVIPGADSETQLFSGTRATVAPTSVKPKETIRPVTGPPENQPPPPVKPKATAPVSPITTEDEEESDDNHAETAEDDETVTIEKCLELLASQADKHTGDNAEEDKPESDPEDKTNTTTKTSTIPPTPAQAPHTDIPAPPAATYSDPLILEHSIKTFARENGFVIVRKRTVPGKSITFKCDRGGNPARNRRKNDTRPGPIVSRLIDCPFDARAQIQKKAGGEWKFTVADPRHNHAPSEDPSGHTANRKLSKELYEQMKKLGDAGLKPAQVLQSLKKTHPDQSILATISTVYSARKKAWAEELRGLSPIVHLIKPHDGLHLSIQDPPPRPSNPHLPIPPSDLDYLQYLPKIIQPDVRDILDVRSDGHCGFRAVAYALGRGQGDYMAVRYELYNEIVRRPDWYRNVFHKLHGALDRIKVDSPSPRSKPHWMSMPSTGE